MLKEKLLYALGGGLSQGKFYCFLMTTGIIVVSINSPRKLATVEEELDGVCVSTRSNMLVSMKSSSEPRPGLRAGRVAVSADAEVSLDPTSANPFTTIFA